MARKTIESEVAGSIWKILVQPGDVLEEDGTILILESMKMEIPALAPDGGRVVELLVAEGEAVREGQPLAVLEALSMTAATARKSTARAAAPVEPVHEVRPPRSLRTLPEQIAEHVYADIVSGHYQPGDRIREEAVAASMGVSRGPVREALRILEKDSVVRVLPNRGAHVTQLSAREVNDIFEIRMELSGAMVRRLARTDRGAAAQFEPLLRQLEKFAGQADKANEYVAASADLLLGLSRASGNERLAEIMQSLARQGWRYTLLSLADQRRRRESARKWRAMFEALAAGRAEAAGRAMEDMVNDTREEVLRLLAASAGS